MSGPPQTTTPEPRPQRRGFFVGSFRFVVYARRAAPDGSVAVHARLLAARPVGLTVVGVFQMAESEWDTLVALCDEIGIATEDEA